MRSTCLACLANLMSSCPIPNFQDMHWLAARPSSVRCRDSTNPDFVFSINFYGAPALSVKEFASYHQDLIIGASLQVTPPLGQYDDTKLVNLGNNRWSFKPELGISKALGPWTLELVPSATFFTDNTDFFFGRTLSQALPALAHRRAPAASLK